MNIRFLTEEDLQIRIQWMNDPKVYKSMHFEVPVHLENTYKWFFDAKNNKSRVDMVFEEDGLLVAMGGLTNIIHDINKAELYIFVNPKIQQKGIGTSATKLLCQYGFEILNLNKIYLATNEDNFAARRVYEKCGFSLEGVLRQEYKTEDGTLLSRMYYGLLKGELLNE